LILTRIVTKSHTALRHQSSSVRVLDIAQPVRRGVALTWVESNTAYVDFKFRRIKRACPNVKCFGLVEVPQTDPGLVAKYVGGVMEHADFMAYSMEELGRRLGGLALMHQAKSSILP
jgi:hypothetical protein